MIKHHLEEIRGDIIIKWKKILIHKKCVEKNAIYNFYLKKILHIFWPTEKGTHFKFQWNFTKNIYKNLKHYFLLHLICDIPHQWFIWTARNLCFRIYFILNQEGPKKSQWFVSLSSRGWNTLPGACSDLDLGQFSCQL